MSILVLQELAIDFYDNPFLSSSFVAILIALYIAIDCRYDSVTARLAGQCPQCRPIYSDQFVESTHKRVVRIALVLFASDLRNAFHGVN